jgi:hypothetical protein
MKLTEYAFSLNVMFDYNEKDQRAASPAERDEYVKLATISSL